MKLFCRAFLIFSKIGSPYAKQAKELIAQCREKMTEERFKDILKENGMMKKNHFRGIGGRVEGAW
ncbi:MAG TPA: hypothetical protein VK469_21000 [Candidatus Kapabacteria bacterium]|nr:hypothetical protein [Candidatus Kapabacteria bacterium]